MDFNDDNADAEFNAAAGAILAITSTTAPAIAQSFDSSCGDLGSKSFGYRVHAATACTAPKYIVFKYLYLNNYKRYLYKILNIAY
jgi:hypothetical protein